MSQGQKLTQGEFLQRCISTHVIKYDYTKSVYVNSHSNIIIGCPMHGEFEQMASNHLMGRNCPKCAREISANKHRKTLEEFVNESNIVHNYFYDYSDTIYTELKQKVSIRCPIHGIFEQFPGNHLKGNRCLLCGNASNSNNSKITLENFIKQANVIHNNKYDYSESFYVDYKSKIKIICSEHGPFMQTVGDHISVHGSGCPGCGENRRAVTYIKNSNLGVHRRETIKKKKYKETELYYQSSYELDFLELCDKYGILIRIKNAPCLSAEYYPYNFYAPDYILDDMYIIEIKSWYIEHLQEKRCPGLLKLKEQLVIDKGYKFLYIRDKDYTNLLRILNPRSM